MGSHFNIQYWKFNIEYSMCLIRLYFPFPWSCKFIRTYQQAGLALLSNERGAVHRHFSYLRTAIIVKKSTVFNRQDKSKHYVIEKS